MDINYLMFLQGIREDFGGENLFLIISALTTSAPTAAILAILYWCINKSAGMFLLFNAQCGRMINDLIKGIFCVYRPWIGTELVPSEVAQAKASSFSFPSGHTQFATAIYGGLGFFYRKNILLVIFCSLIVLLVAFSRNFLGVHTPQDVLIAIIYSIGLFYASEKLFNWIGNNNERKALFFLVGIISVLIIFLILYFKPYPEDFLNGKLIVDPQIARTDAFDALGFGLSFFLGWLFEERFIKFKVNVSNKDKLWRIIIGFAILGVIAVIIYPLLKYFLSLAAYKFWKAFLPFFSILFVIPLIFTRVERHFKR